MCAHIYIHSYWSVLYIHMPKSYRSTAVPRRNLYGVFALVIPERKDGEARGFRDHLSTVRPASQSSLSRGMMSPTRCALPWLNS